MQLFESCVRGTLSFECRREIEFSGLRVNEDDMLPVFTGDPTGFIRARLWRARFSSYPLRFFAAYRWELLNKTLERL